MLGLFTNWLGSKANPIGVDFGSDTLKLAQVAREKHEWKLIAAASADVPSHVRRDPAGRMNFFVEAVRDLLAGGKFNGRQAVLSMPVASMFIQHLRLPKMDDATLKKMLPWEARGKLPIDPNHALLRHYVAGDIYQEQDPKSEVILMAAGRELVKTYLHFAARAKLDVVGMNVEPMAIVDCFTKLFRRKSDAEATYCFVDIGCGGTRAYIVRNWHMLFARAIPVGGDHFNRAVGQGLGITEDDAKVLRGRLSTRPASVAPAALPVHETAPVAEAPHQEAEGFAILGAALAAAKKQEASETPAVERRQPEAQEQKPAAAEPPVSPEAERVFQASREPLNKLVEELDLCRRYYESAFPDRPVDRLIFLGGEARHKDLCQHIAQELGVAAQIGDPVARMAKGMDIGPETGIDRRIPQPNWAVAIGLSCGSAAVESALAEAA